MYTKLYIAEMEFHKFCLRLGASDFSCETRSIPFLFFLGAYDFSRKASFTYPTFLSAKGRPTFHAKRVSPYLSPAKERLTFHMKRDPFQGLRTTFHVKRLSPYFPSCFEAQMGQIFLEVKINMKEIYNELCKVNPFRWI